ncbi:MAG: transcription-repair coupling factor [Spirochaetaceae bacterium]|jgi:transcription-repair coupling factor (superfamily II helicase)|nr:transcription-repair coupling factor [Spirochaetaceae bacterium]
MNSQTFSFFADGISASPVLAPLISAYTGGHFPLEVEGAEGGLHSLIIAEFAKRRARPLLVVTPSERDAAEIAADLRALELEAVLFPWWGTMPYRSHAPTSPVWGERARILCDLAGNMPPPVLVTSQRAFMSPLPPPEYTAKQRVLIKPGDKLDTAALSARLSGWGYTRVQRVQLSGEYAVRGEVVDVMTGGDGDEAAAYRVTLDFDRVETIKRFDAANQASLSQKNRIALLSLCPLKEVVWDDERIDRLGANLSLFPEFSGKRLDGGGGLIDRLISKGHAADEELFFPLAFEKPAALTDYYRGLSGGEQDGQAAVVIFLEWERLANAQTGLDREYAGLFRSAFRERPVPAPERLLYNFDSLVKDITNKVSFLMIKKSTSDISASTDGAAASTACDAADGAAAGGAGVPRHFTINCDPPRNFFGNINYMKEEFTALLRQDWRIVITAESDIQVLRIRELLKDIEPLHIIQIQLSRGFALGEIKLLIVQEKEIFGFRRRPHSLQTARSVAIDTFVDLNPGDFVVHINYGIGLFKGIERINALGNERDYIKLEFAEAETIFVPIEQVNLVQRYIGSEGSPPRLDKIGSKGWSERKARAKKAAEELASRLISLYSKRKASRGFAFPPDSEWQVMFEANFAFEETEDQARCVEEIKADMESVVPMDRLVCGDVGYGKTEVAVRACFKAVMSGKQAAFLAPTTILAEQHYENFIERFRNFPVRVAMLSRFVDKKTTRDVLARLKTGEIDILAGTHRIIQKDIVFKDLGLMVIDEEQRFGVKDKERLKELKHNVDCLALSATPIPRTLHMSLLKIRDMSILATPPRNRLPIETFIDEYDEEAVARAIRFEVERGGQVFYLHNRIESLNDVKARLSHLVPEVSIETAHGQVDAEDLEDVMHRFIHGGFHVLVSTTIIENGIDIPNVNTIIIDRADMYGVSQLYQLRGRVGRGGRAAYAYLFYPSDTALSENAMKRLQVISDFTGLGSGFKIAMKDMEIRGAGNLLGREQSGDIFSVGFDLYVRLLDEAIRKLQNENYETEPDTLLELEYTGFIPNSYIDSAQEKMEVYKKIAAVKSRDELEHVSAEIYDRFGPPPFEVLSLLSLAEIRIICREISISSLKEHNGMVRAEFTKVSNVNVDRLLRLIKESGGRVKLDPKSPNVILLQTGKIGLKEKSEFIREKLEALV